jgi:hypothetical protein
MKTITFLIHRTLVCLSLMGMSALACAQTTTLGSNAVAGRIEFISGSAQIKKLSGTSAPVQQGSLLWLRVTPSARQVQAMYKLNLPTPAWWR